MKVVIFGATGQTGRELLQQALNRGHYVTAIVRDPAAIVLTHQRLHVTVGDALKPDSFAPALEQQDAVLSAIGISSFWASLKPMTFHRQSAQNIVAQMNRAGVKRLVCLTSVGVLDKPVGPLFYRWLVKPLLRHKYEDMRQMEQIVRKSTLEWTIVRPFRLVSGERTGHVRVGVSGTLDNAGSISRADLAEFMLGQLESEANWQQTIAVAY
ncbi:NAD(P)-dependent oxidoreductase [Spirosoma aerolatum]|uniref:NAD(P)-dependent oxidoreductase n=1 Tax=Spirosoma aerolatum TaxID=1211326 RepID=UPI0009AEB691|nr:SDR family oxidoreductase [Spirosoma aerolatum]